MSEKSASTAQVPTADEPRGFNPEASITGAAGAAAAESAEILNLLGEQDSGGSCCGGSCCA